MHLVTKNIKGHDYLYLAWNAKEGDRWKKRYRYLGKGERAIFRAIKELIQQGELSQEVGDRLIERFDRDIWGSPSFVIDLARQVMGSIDLDPCTTPQNPVRAARFFTKADDGLRQQWEGRIWLNPPYSKPLPWVNKLVKAYQAGEVKQAIALVKSGVLQNRGTGPLIHSTATVKAAWRGRLKFESLRAGRSSKSPDFDVSLVYWGPAKDRFVEVFQDYCFF